MKGAYLFILFFLLACSSDNEQDASAVIPERPMAGIAIPMIEENVSNDTLLVHETFDLGDGTYFMTARNNNEPADNSIDPGLRLYHYSILSDGSPEILAYSKPAYDSWMMRPNFFKHPEGGFLILAEFGSTESWGQKVMHFNGERFVDLGFLEIAKRVVKQHTEIDSTYYGLNSIAPFVDLSFENNAAVIQFNCDSVLLFDDTRGALDTIYAAKDVSYVQLKQGLTLQLPPR